MVNFCMPSYIATCRIILCLICTNTQYTKYVGDLERAFVACGYGLCKVCLSVI